MRLTVRTFCPNLRTFYDFHDHVSKSYYLCYHVQSLHQIPDFGLGSERSPGKLSFNASRISKNGVSWGQNNEQHQLIFCLHLEFFITFWILRFLAFLDFRTLWDPWICIPFFGRPCQKSHLSLKLQAEFYLPVPSALRKSSFLRSTT